MKHTRKLAAGVAAVAAVAGGGAAFAATQDNGPSADAQAVIDDAAKQLGVQPSALSAALKKAIENRVDAAVAAGRLTKAQGDELKARIEAGGVPPIGLGFGIRHGRGFGLFGELGTATTYLGMTGADLRSALESGKTLAQVAQAQGKSVSGLVTVLVDAAKKQLDQAVADGRLSSQQRQDIESNLTQHVTDLVNGVKPAGPPPGPSGAPFGERRIGGAFAGPRI
jgi:hypothetical protein